MHFLILRVEKYNYNKTANFGVSKCIKGFSSFFPLFLYYMERRRVEIIYFSFHFHSQLHILYLLVCQKKNKILDIHFPLAIFLCKSLLPPLLLFIFSFI